MEQYGNMESQPASRPGAGEDRRPAWKTVPSAFDPRAKSPVLACFLSLVPGLGQIYVGHYQRGFIHGITFAGLIAILTSFSDKEFSPLIPLIAIFLFFFFLYNIIDAGRRAALYNEMLQGGSLADLPKEELPGARGSLAGGLVLIMGGLVLLMHTQMGWSLEWVERWWPAAFILVGFYLLYKNFEGRAAEKVVRSGSTDRE
jgi:TM2 domain-containing membrane protein YozV